MESRTEGAKERFQWEGGEDRGWGVGGGRARMSTGSGERSFHRGTHMLMPQRGCRGWD